MASNRKNRIITWWDWALEIKYQLNRLDNHTEGNGYFLFTFEMFSFFSVKKSQKFRIFQKKSK